MSNQAPFDKKTKRTNRIDDRKKNKKKHSSQVKGDWQGQALFVLTK